MNPANLGIRILAGIVDTIILVLIFYVIAVLTGQTTEGGFELTGGPALLAFAVYFLYFIVLEAARGATIGKMLLGLKVVRADGHAIAWRESIIRNLLRLVDGFLLYLVGLILILTSSKRQRLGDHIADTMVVKKSDVPASAG